MKQAIKTAPSLRARETARTMMGDMLIAAVPLYVMATYFYGVRPLMLGIASAAVCWCAELLATLISGKRPNFADLSSLVTGLLLALLFPASASYRVVITAALFAMLVAKHPFGGTGQNPFNPAAAGFAFAAVCWPSEVFSYPIPLDRLENSGEIAARLAPGVAELLRQGAVPALDSMELLLGNFSGPMGATHILVMETCLLFLLIRKTVNWRVPLGFLAISGLLAWLFPRIPADPMDSLIFELCSGAMVFAAVYMLPDPVTSPKTNLGRLVYGCLGGVAAFLFRRYGGFAQGEIFAVLLMNALAYTIDRFSYQSAEYIRRVRLELAKFNKG